MANRGPKCRLTADLQDKITGLVVEGIPLMTACAKAGISYDTCKLWRKRGRAEPDSEFGLFDMAVTTAQAEAEIQLIRSVWQSAMGNARDAQWMLDRRFASRWAAQSRVDTRVEHSAKPGSGIMVYLPSNGRDSMADAVTDAGEDDDGDA